MSFDFITSLRSSIVHSLLFFVISLSIVTAPFLVFAQSNAYQSNELGDVIVSSSPTPDGDEPPPPSEERDTGIEIFADGTPIFDAIEDVVDDPTTITDSLIDVYDGLDNELQDTLVNELLDVLDGGGALEDILGIIDLIDNIQSIIDDLSSGNTDIGEYLLNAVSWLISNQSDLTSVNANDLLSAVLGGGGGGGGMGNVTGKGGERIKNCAMEMIGDSTADVAGTEGGALGCALAVSRILECAGYGVGTTLGTEQLYAWLDADPCYEKVDTGHITDADAMNLQEGDVLVTKRGSRAGHTGIYVGNGNIVSNSSSGFAGSQPGTIQQNYTVDRWYGVTSRNPGGSAVFRRICE